LKNVAQILIVSENDSDTGRLQTAFRDAGHTSEVAKSITAGCELAKSGRFEVMFCRPGLGDQSWRRLIDTAHRYDLSFAIVLFTRTFDLNEWGDALQVGAFDVMDALCDLPKAAEVAERALKGTLPKRMRPHFEQ
jgi:DNA-binding NtrC family response regulator